MQTGELKGGGLTQGLGNQFPANNLQSPRLAQKIMAQKTKVKAKTTKKKVVKKKPTTKKKKRGASRRSKNKALTLTLTPAPIKQNQLLFILQRTPKEHIYNRPAKGGGTWTYVTGVYVKKALNHIFGWMWDFQIIDKGREGDLVWVQGRLTIKNKSAKPMIIKEQFGRADVKFKRGTKTPLDYGNDLKAAATDALKKCASELGIASDVYGKSEFQIIQKQDKGFTPPAVEVVEPKPEPKIQPIVETKLTGEKVAKLKTMLRGKTDAEKMANLKTRTGIVPGNGFNITEKHAGILIASLLNSEVK